MSDIVDTIVDMGFTKAQVELAVSTSGSTDPQTIIDWILSHPVDIEPSETQATGPGETEQCSSSAEQMSSETPAVSPPAAKSIRCDDCGKLFKTNAEVEFHASKSGHENFSESTEEKKPLTEEERQEQLAKIEAKLKQRRLEREAREKAEALEREKARIRSGKDMLEARKKHDELEMKKIVEQRKKEKEDERLARQRVREQIEADKLARKAKFGGGQDQEQIPPPAPVAVPIEKKPAQNYSQVKLQIRLTDGKTIVQDFGIKEPLSAVRLYVEMNGGGEGPFKLMTSFPRKVFSNEDYEMPLEKLGLAPTATLIVSKS